MHDVLYNEIDAYAAQWLRNLAAAGHLPAGTVDERSILDLDPDDLRPFRQCHFFAGIGGWPYAIHLAGWPDDREVWTGSCPCQPLSSAGQRRGHADERHLWPAFYRLIAELRPATVFGEQVASRDGREWFSGVRADLEHLGYAVGAADLSAAGVGAPHIRQRLFWVAESAIARRSAQPGRHGGEDGRPEAEPRRLRNAGGLADAERAGVWSGRGNDAGEAREVQEEVGKWQRFWPDTGTDGSVLRGLADAERAIGRPLGQHREHGCDGPDGGRTEAHGESGACGEVRGLADAGSVNLPASPLEGGQAVVATEPGGAEHRGAGGLGDAIGAGLEGYTGDGGNRDEPGWNAETQDRPVAASGYWPGGGLGDTGSEREGAVSGIRRGQNAETAGNPWSSAVWLPCLDGKARRVEPTIQPLAHAGEWGTGSRVGILRGAGNAIVPACAAAFIKAFLEC